VFEREAREFQSYHVVMFQLHHSNHKNVIRIAHSYHKKITRKSTFECTLECYENLTRASRSNTGTSTSSPGTCANQQPAHGLTCPGGPSATVAYLPFMANDGSGDNIRIPSFIVSQFDGQNIKSALCEQGDKST
jgi:hypothetical protein